MSLVCAMEKCKAKKGPCNCEKVMGALVLIGAAAFAFFKLRA